MAPLILPLLIALTAIAGMNVAVRMIKSFGLLVFVTGAAICIFIGHVSLFVAGIALIAFYALLGDQQGLLAVLLALASGLSTATLLVTGIHREVRTMWNTLKHRLRKLSAYQTHKA